MGGIPNQELEELRSSIFMFHSILQMHSFYGNCWGVERGCNNEPYENPIFCHNDWSFSGSF